MYKGVKAKYMGKNLGAGILLCLIPVLREMGFERELLKLTKN